MMGMDKGLLRAYLDGELSASENKQVQQALASSPELEECLIELRQIREQVKQSLDRLAPTVATVDETAAFKRLQVQLKPRPSLYNTPIKNVPSSTIWESPALLAEIKSDVKQFRYHWRQFMSKGFIGVTIAGFLIVIGAFVLILWPEMGQREASLVASLEKLQLPVIESKEPQTTTVVVALQPITQGSEFIAGSIGRRDWPTNQAPVGFIAGEAETIGKVARTDIRPGQVIVQGMLVEASAARPELPGGATPVSAVFNHEIELVGYNLPQNTVAPKGTIDLTLYWRSLQKVSHDYTVFIHLADASGQILIQADSAPLQGKSPTSQWQLNQIIEDYHAFPIAENFPEGSYDLIVGLFNNASGERLSVPSSSTQASSLLLTQIRIEVVKPATLNPNERLLFQSGSDIQVMSADGTNQTRLAAGDSPTWSPDGQHLAFLAPVEGRNEIYVLGVNETTPTRLTYSSGIQFQPDWSPDGQQLAFVVGPADLKGASDIYVINVNGTNQLKLTDGSALNVGPQWSPNGQRLAFSSRRGNQSRVYIISADGSGLTKLTDEAQMSWRPTWSPDGKQIAFITRKDETDNIYLINAVCTSLSEECRANPIRLTDNPALAKLNTDITWSPDGQRLAFVLDIAGQTALYVMNADGSAQKRLTDQLNVGYDIAWSPDGRWLAFLAYSAAKTKANLYLISADGAPLIQRVDNAAGLSVEWLPHPVPKIPLSTPPPASRPR